MAGQLQAFLKATLLGLVLLLLSMATVAPHACSRLRTFLVATLPAAASALAATPSCLFVFSNIIVVFLATGSKKLLRTAGADDDEQPQYSQSSEEMDAVAALVHAIMKEGCCYDDHVKMVGSEVQEEEDRDGVVLGGDMESVEEEVMWLPPADELKKKVEEFIARFNMERQLEARMLVCCC